MSNADKWLFGFITMWILLCAGKPDIIDAITVRVMGSQCTYDSYAGNRDKQHLEMLLAEHKARENLLVKIVHQNGLITDKEFIEMTAKSLE